MKVLVTGSQGQVGTELMCLAHDFDVGAVGVSHDKLDITHQVAVQTFISEEQPDAVINAAAYTAVDKAEDDADAAYAVNAKAVGYLAQACADLDIPLVHISTDYVFDGSKQGAYTEEDAVSPLGVYGETKLAGEAEVQKYCAKHYILRTSWVFSAHGNNFVKTMLRLGKEREQLGIVADQYGKPTSASEIARVIYQVLKSDEQVWGIYHMAQPDVISWFGFAEAIFVEARKQGVKLAVNDVKAIATEDYPTPAQRPANSELDCSKLEHTFGINIKPWAASLSEVMKALR